MSGDPAQPRYYRVKTDDQRQPDDLACRGGKPRAHIRDDTPPTQSALRPRSDDPFEHVPYVALVAPPCQTVSYDDSRRIGGERGVVRWGYIHGAAMKGESD